MKKAISVSRILKWSAIAFCVALPLIEAGYWITQGYPFLKPWIQFDALLTLGQKSVAWSDLNELQKFLGFVINMIPIAFSMIALGCLAQLFKAFEELRFFERRNARSLKRAGWALVFSQIVFPLYMAALSVALTFRYPVGQRTLCIGWGTHQFAILALGLSLLLISWIFEEASALNEEQKATI